MVRKCPQQGILVASATSASSNFKTWNFTSIWIQYEGHTNPLQGSFATPLTVTSKDTTKAMRALFDNLSQDNAIRIAFLM